MLCIKLILKLIIKCSLQFLFIILYIYFHSLNCILFVLLQQGKLTRSNCVLLHLSLLIHLIIHWGFSFFFKALCWFVCRCVLVSCLKWIASIILWKQWYSPGEITLVQCKKSFSSHSCFPLSLPPYIASFCNRPVQTQTDCTILSGNRLTSAIALC